MTQLWMHRLFPPWPTVNRLLQPRQCCFIQQQGLLPRRGIPSSIPSSVWRGRGVVEAWRKRHGSSYLHRRDPGPLVLLVAGGGGDKIPRRLPLFLSTAEDVCLLDDLQVACLTKCLKAHGPFGNRPIRHRACLVCRSATLTSLFFIANSLLHSLIFFPMVFVRYMDGRVLPFPILFNFFC